MTARSVTFSRWFLALFGAALWACSGDNAPKNYSHLLDSQAETAVPVSPADFVIVNQDTSTYADQGYAVLTFELNPQAANPYDSLQNSISDLDTGGNPVTYRPTFYLVRPLDSEGQPLVDLIWFHGGSIADDRDFDETGEMPRGCVSANLAKYAQQSVSSTFLPLVMAMEQGWAMVVPRNDWCDYWTGLGPEDPVDPDRHFGAHHVDRVFSFLASGGAGYVPSGTRYAWGTSVGGAAAIHLAHKHKGFQAIVVDSSPSSMLMYHTEDPAAVESFLGGPPYDSEGLQTAYFEKYTRVSAERLISDHDFRIPITMIWNSQDQLLGSSYPESLNKALRNFYTPEKVPWAVHDFNHAAPGAMNHTQSKLAAVPWGYTGLALVAFLQGKEVTWVEAEAGCSGILKSTCTIGVVKTAPEGGNSDLQVFSQESVRQSLSEDGEGILWADIVPDSLPREQSIDAIAVVQIEGIEEVPDDEIVGFLGFQTQHNLEIVPLLRSEFAPKSGATTAENLLQYRSTRMKISIPQGETPTLTWRATGFGRTRLDAIIYLSDRE
jgi:hypothetical protein